MRENASPVVRNVHLTKPGKRIFLEHDRVWTEKLVVGSNWELNPDSRFRLIALPNHALMQRNTSLRIGLAMVAHLYKTRIAT